MQMRVEFNKKATRISHTPIKRSVLQSQNSGRVLNSVQTFLLNILDNMPRLRVSSSLMRVFLWMLRESGAKDVPSFDRLRQVQKEVRAEYGIPSIPCKSPLGNVFFINDNRTIIAQVCDPFIFY